MRLRTLVLAVALLWPVSVLSEFATGNFLFERCVNDNDKVGCAAYVEGVTDGFTYDRTICVPSDVNITVRQVVDVVVNYLRAHPEQRHYSAPSLAHEALMQAFPCKR